MARVAIFLDGGYLQQLRRSEFRRVAIDYSLLAERIRDRIAGDTAEPLDILRTYYYDCPPYQSSSPTPEEARRFADYRRFADALRDLALFEPREGRLQISGRLPDGSPICQQKQADCCWASTSRCSACGAGSRMPRSWPATATSYRRCGRRSRRASRSGCSTARARGRAEMDAAFMASAARASG